MAGPGRIVSSDPYAGIPLSSPPEFAEQDKSLSDYLDILRGPSAVESLTGAGGADSALMPVAEFADKYLRGLNPMDIGLGQLKQAGTWATRAPINLARAGANVLSSLPGEGAAAEALGVNPDLESYLSPDSDYDPSGRSLIGKVEDLSAPGGILHQENLGQQIGGGTTDLAAMMALQAGGEAAGAGAMSKLAPYAPRLAGALGTVASNPAVRWLGRNAGMGAAYGQLLENEPEKGAVAGFIGGATLDPLIAGAGKLAPFLESAAEKSLGRVIAPGKEAWKDFVGKNATEIIKKVPLSAASPFAEGGGLKGIEAFAQSQADSIGVALDEAYRLKEQPNVGPKLLSIRNRIRATADGLLTAHGQQAIELAPESRAALQEIRTRLATGQGRLNPEDTNISALMSAYHELNSVIGTLGPEIQTTGLVSPRAPVGQTIQRAIAGGAQSTAEQGIAQAMAEIENVITGDLQGTRIKTKGLADRIDALRTKFGDINAAGEFVSSDPNFSNNIAKLANNVRAFGPEINAQQLRGLARDWGEIVAGGKGTGFLVSMADESMKGAMKSARGQVETSRDALMGDKVRDQSNEFAFWKRLADAAESTTERRVGHTGGGLFGAMAALAGLGEGAHLASAAGHGAAASLGAGALVAAPVAAVAVRVMRSPLWNLFSAKTKIALAQALREGTVPVIATAMRRALLELSLLDYGGLKALGHQNLTATEADTEHANVRAGRGPTPGLLATPSPDTVYGIGGSPDPYLDQHRGVLEQQDQIDQSIEEAAPLDPQTESRVYDKLANTPVATAGISKFPEWLQTQMVNAPDLGPTHPHLQKLANLIAEQTSPLNAAFLAVEGARPLAVGGRMVKPVEAVGKGLAAAMAAAGLQTGLEGVVEGRPGKVIGGGTQAALGALGLRGGGLAGAAEEATAALTPAARRAGGFATRLGQGLKAAGTQAVIGPAIGLASTSLADTDLAKSLIPDDETRNAVFNAAGMGIGVGGLAMAAGRGMKGLRDTREGAPTEWFDRNGQPLAEQPPLTAPQRAALDKLKALEAQGWPQRTTLGSYATGINAHTLATLRQSGYISGDTWARGVVGKNIKIFDPADIVSETPPSTAAERAPKVEAMAPLSKRLEAVRDFRETLTDEQHAALVDEIKQAFPPKDKYTKPVHPMTPKTLLKRGEEMSPEAQQFLAAAVTGLDKKGTIAPLELHAMIEGTDYAPKRLVREPLPEDYDYSQQIKGAPLGVQTPEHEQNALDHYMDLATEGQRGAKWYVQGGKQMLAHVGDDPEAARNLSALHSIFSSATSINVNSPFAIKAWIQKQVGRAIKSGRYPKAMSNEAEKVFTGTSDIQQNLKRGAFYNETNEAGGFAKPGVIPRPTNDIWQSEAWGYANADGTPHRSSVTPEMHAWMDRMTQQAVDRANAEGLGGRTDWTLGEMQAAAWTGVRDATMKAQGKKIPPYYDFGTGLTSSYAQGGREAIAHPSTEHLKGLGDPENRHWLDRYSQLIYEATHDEHGRDLISLGVGGLTGKSVRGPGEYQGQPAPGVQTQMSTTGMQGEKLRGVKARPTDLETSSAELGKAAEAIYAIHTGQGALAFGRFFPKGPVAGRNAFKVVLDRVPSASEFQQLKAEMVKRKLDVENGVAKIFTPDGYVVKNLGRRGLPMDKILAAIKAVHPDAEVTVGRHSGQFEMNDWGASGQQVGQRYYKMIPEAVMSRYEQFGPDLQRRIDTKLAQFHKESGGKFLPAPLLGELHAAIRDQGPRAAFASLAAKYGVSAVLLSLLAKQMGWYRVSDDESQAS